MYAEFYGLSGEPFLLTPDPQFYFESSVHAQAMAHLLYGINRGEGFIVVTGEVGAGKTTLVQRLCATIDSARVAPAHIVTTLLGAAELLRMVCAAFGIEDVPKSKDAALLRIRHHLEALHQEGRKALLIVDEAQNLPPRALEELRMLSNFQVGNTSPCQIFLIGQPQFRDTMAHPNLEQLRQRVIAAYHLGPLQSDECEQYLLHRLRHVGWKNDPLFEPGAIEAIFEHTGGIPRRINTLCSRLLLLGFLDDLHVFTAQDAARVAADLREENGPAPSVIARPVKASENYLDGIEDTGLWNRVEMLEERVDAHEKTLRHIFAGLTKMVDPRWFDRR